MNTKQPVLVQQAPRTNEYQPRGRPSSAQPATLVYRGALSEAANQRLFELYVKTKPRPRLLKVTSGGGDITLGMDLGEWVFQNGLDVEVVDHCFSSCANYVFTAAKAKYLNPCATNRRSSRAAI